MKRNYTNKILLGCILLIIEIFRCDFAGAERFVTVASIGNTPDLVEGKTNQEIVDYVISFWDKELKKVLKSKPDLIVLPEFCDLSTAGVGYMTARQNQVLDYFASVASKNGCYIAFGTGRQDNEGFWRNSCIVLGRNGKIAGIYDKNFPTIAEMKAGIKASEVASLIDCDFGRLAIAICFDLNFVELLNAYAGMRPDIIIYPSMSHGGVLQDIWAYACQSYFVGSIYRGFPSEVRNPLGDVIASTGNNSDYVVTRINLDFKRVPVAYNYDNLTALKSKYGKTVEISNPGENGSVIVTSRNRSISAEQMIKEFDIELYDDYLDRAREIKKEEGKTD